MAGQSPSFVAGAKIYPRRFVVKNGTDHTVIQASAATTMLTGITHKGTKHAPISTVTDNPHADTGDEVAVHGDGETCELDVGSGALNAGDLLTSDADGKAVAAAAGNYYGAQAVADSGANGIVRVSVVRGQLN